MKNALGIVYFVVAIVAVPILYTLFRSNVSTSGRWIFWLVLIGGLWTAAWLVAKKQGKSFWSIWEEEDAQATPSGSPQKPSDKTDQPSQSEK